MKPVYVAICGRPTSGKTEFQNVLREYFGIHPVDDGAILREFAPQLFGYDPSLPYSQEGKLENVEVAPGQSETVRWTLGELGQALENHFGEHIIPFCALKGCQKYWEEAVADPTRMKPAPSGFSFGSVRKTQGQAYKKMGGIVIEIARPGAPESPYAFDRYDASCVDYTIVNDSPDLSEFRAKARREFAEILIKMNAAL